MSVMVLTKMNEQHLHLSFFFTVHSAINILSKLVELSFNS